MHPIFTKKWKNIYILNTRQKYVYKIAIFTDATDFDHQPLLLVKNTIAVKERKNS